ncbi:MAG TPA: BTAD domain-containing putative transcriptional regulator, partial [Gaiellaceae bacterium]
MTEFRMLGPLEVRDGGEAVPLGGRKQRVVLAHLLLRANAAVPRAQLVDLIWGERPPKSAIGSLQVYVHGLRQSLGADRIETRGSSYRLQVEPGELDLHRFRELVATARAELAKQHAVGAAAALDEALALWRGPALASLLDDESVVAAAASLEEERLEAVELRVDAELALGRPALVVADLQQLIEQHPYRERPRGQLIVALYRSGRQTEALDAYRAARDAWVEELGVEPSPELQELERAVLRHDPSLAGPSPETAETTRLPVPPTPLIGRRLEVAAVSALLREDARLVTLVGPGGTGKTRLAIAVARELAAELEDGAVFVDLSATTDPKLLLPAIAQALGVADSGEELPAHVARHAPLLVLDNLEQLLPAAPRIAELLAASPRLRVLATSRAPLRLSGEHVYPVPPLALPPVDATADELRLNDAARLFVTRADAADPGFELAAANAASVAAICRRLDGLPLALELAAARVRHLSPGEMLVRLERLPELLGSGPRDAPARQRTLAATIAWSFDLLDADERDGLVQLSVFAGGFPLDAAECVCGVDLGVLGALVDNSLVQRQPAAVSETRFTMLETVRSYALDRLEERDDRPVHRRHAEWLVELAERAEADLLAGRDFVPWLDRIEAEHENVRAALGWSLEHGAAGLALRLVSALRYFWEVRGHFAEAERWLDVSLAAGAAEDPALRVKALAVSGTIAFRTGKPEQARAPYEEMLAISRELGDEEGIARGLSDLGTVAAALGDNDEATRLLEESAAGFRRLGAHKRLAVVLANLGHVAAERGDFERATAVTKEALALERAVGQRSNEAISLYNLGSHAFEAGDHAESRTWLRECVGLTLELGYKEVMAYALATVARILVAENEPARAATVAGVTDRLL